MTSNAQTNLTNNNAQFSAEFYNEVKTNHKRHRRSFMKRHWQLYLLVLIPLLFIIIFQYVPIYGIQIAFKDFSFRKGISGSHWAGFKYFDQFFKSPSFFSTIKNTLALSVYGLIAGFPFPIILAIALNECKRVKFKKTVQMITYAPYFISTVILVSIILQLLDPQVGVINKLIASFGRDPINFAGEAKYFRSLYVWSGIWQTTGYSAIIYLAALSGVSSELQEAAVIDGASKLKRIWHVDLPSIKPTIIILLILNIGSLMSVGFDKNFLMQNSMNVATSETIGTYVYKVGLQNNNFSFSTAIGLFNSIVSLILMLSANFIAKKLGETSLL